MSPGEPTRHLRLIPRRRGRRRPWALLLAAALGCGGDDPASPRLYAVSASGFLQNLGLCCPLAVAVALDENSDAWDTINAPQPRGTIFWSTTQAVVQPGAHTLRLSVVNDSVTPATYQASAAALAWTGAATLQSAAPPRRLPPGPAADGALT